MVPANKKCPFADSNSKGGIYFLSHLAVGALMTGAAIPPPPIIESVNKTVKIGSKCKIIHSKHCRIDKFSNVYEEKMPCDYCCL